MKWRAILSGIALALATAAVMLTLQSTGKGSAPGFIGSGVLSADINIVLEVLLVLGLTVGALLARAGNIEAHRVNQTIWVLVNAVLVALLMVPSFRNVKVGNFAALKDTGTLITLLHGLIGALTLAGGLWLVLQMNDILPARWHIRWWKTLMRLTLAGYWAVALLGLATYHFWYAE